MHESNPLESFLFFLLAAVIAVPVFRRVGLGAILGYLFAGVLIGPYALHLITDPESVLHFAEIGVVLLLFVIGLELNPNKLWSMRHQIGLLGGGQLFLTSLLLLGLGLLFGHMLESSLIIALTLALSSTAFAIQLMAERGILASANGRRGLAILLMQDMAVIPILILVQLLVGSSSQEETQWWHVILAFSVLFLCGRYCLNPILSLVSRFGSQESMTAMALLIVVGAAYLMSASGLSMGLGAFVAGIMLANSHFRHQLETDIEPFKGLTLGLFFIAIGMTLDISLLMQSPFLILVLAMGLMTLKTLVITVLLRFNGIQWRQGMILAVMLSQGGEFAFVIFAQAGGTHLIPMETVNLINLVVGISMALTVPLTICVERLTTTAQNAVKTESETLAQEKFEQQSEVLILGFGRFAQMTGRILTANHIPFTALDNNSAHIQFIQRFGNTVHFGDITRLDVLRMAGLDRVTTVLVTIEDGNKAEAVVKLIRVHYPKITIIARAYNRVAYLKLINAGADSVIREIFSGSLEAATETLIALGFTVSEALKTVELFKQHDETLLERALEHHDDLNKVIEIGLQGRQELEALFRQDSDRNNG